MRRLSEVAHDHTQAHHHAISPDADRRRLLAALTLTLILAFMAVEVIAGVRGA